MIGRLACLILLAAAAWAQSTPPMTFEVASVKVHEGPLTRLVDYSASGSRLTLEGYYAFDLVAEAYNLKRYQISFAPSAKRDDTVYDIVAKAPGDGPRKRSEFREMLQTLLAERFHLQLRREPKEMPVYFLVVGRNGPKLQESAPDAQFSANHHVHGRNQTVDATHFTMDQLADEIWVDRPVLNRTGLTGFYEIHLEATPEFRINRDPQPEDLSVFTALQQQLGLRLTPEKAMIEVLVVERLDKPSAN